MLKRKFDVLGVLGVLFVIITLGLLLYRISIHADIYDEIINLDIAYRMAMGDVPFYNCWEAFQSGDIILAFFVFAYVKIFSTTSGIVLYSRIIYILCLAVLAICTYICLKKTLDKKYALLISYSILFFQLYSLFYLWYDTVSVLLLYAGCLLLFNALFENRKLIRIIKLSIAGLLHCIMAFSYPAFAVLAICIAIILLYIEVHCFKKNILQSIKSIFFYGLGAVFFCCLLLLYFQMSVGIKNVFDTFNIIVGSRETNGFDILDMLQAICNAYINVNKYLIVVAIILLILYFRILRTQKGITIFFSFMVCLPFFNQFFIGENAYMGLANYLSFVMLCCPFVYSLINEITICDKVIYYLFWIPSILSMFFITMTTVYVDIGPVKCWQASLPGAIATLYFMCKIMDAFGKRALQTILLYIVIVILLFNSYSYIYLNQPYVQMDDERVPHGVYKGIKVSSVMDSILEVEPIIRTYVGDNKTILAGANLRPVYLMSRLRPYVWSVETPAYYDADGRVYWDIAIKYFEYFSELPDVICVQGFEIEGNEDIQGILNDEYSLVFNEIVGNIDLHIYQKNGVTK